MRSFCSALSMERAFLVLPCWTNLPRERQPRHGSPMKTVHVLAALLALATAAPGQVQAQEDAASYPSRTVRLIVPSSAGGPIDAVTRIMADAFKAAWPVPVVVENKPGAGTSTGAAFVAAAPPDGYTLLVQPDSIAANPSLYPNLSYDPLKSFEPVSMLVTAA